MYDSPHRRRGLLVAGPRARQASRADAHMGGREDFLRRHGEEAALATRSARRPDFLRRLADRAADLRNLRLAWGYLAAHGGPAPGPDGVTFEQLSERDVWATLHALKTVLLAGTYRAGPARVSRIPKPSGGTRALSVRSIIDRVAGRALIQALQPYLDPQFLDTSFGFRPGVATDHAVAAASQLANEGKWVWVTADLATAFDNVPLNRLLDVVRLYLPDDRVVGLVRAVVGTGARGIGQGSPLSPLLLNLYLHHTLDVPWRRRYPGITLLRYADDLLLLADTASSAGHALADLSDRCRAVGLPLKPAADPVRDLRAETQAEWLGLVFSRTADGRVVVRTGPKRVAKLRGDLLEVTSHPGGYARTRAVIEGWVGALGPCHGYEPADRVYAEVRRAVDGVGADGVPDVDEVSRWLRRAGERYRRATRDLGRGGPTSPSVPR